MCAAINSHKITHDIRSFFGKFAHVSALLRELESLVSAGEQKFEAEHLVVLGEEGMGKSRLVEYFSALHPRIEHEEFTEVPVLVVEVPSNCTPKGLVSAMLCSLESPYWNIGDADERTRQLATLLRACRVRLVILDEVNHLADRGAAKSHYAVADRLKEITNDIKIPFVLTGMPSVRILLEANEQLRDRFRNVKVLQPLSLGSDEEAKRTRTILKAYRKLLGELRSIDFTDKDYARQIVFATGGRLRPLRKLLVSAVRFASASPAPFLDQAELERAFRDQIWFDAPRERNPFSDKFSGMPLTKPGEPFAPPKKGAL